MNTYFYPDWQIREWYNGAKNQVEQVFILADLCAVCYEEMIRYLTDELKLLTPEVLEAVQKQLAELREQEEISRQRLEERRERRRKNRLQIHNSVAAGDEEKSLAGIHQ